MILFSDCILFLLVGISLPEIRWPVLEFPCSLSNPAVVSASLGPQPMGSTHNGGTEEVGEHSCWPRICIAPCGLDFPLGMGAAGNTHPCKPPGSQNQGPIHVSQPCMGDR